MRRSLSPEFLSSLLVVLFLLGCGPGDEDVIVIDTGSDNSTPSGNASDGSDSSNGDTACAECDGGEYEDELAFCVEFINELRARVDRPALSRSADLEACASAAARADAGSGQPHGHFRQTQGCDFTALAENEVPGWSASRYDGVRGVVEAGAESMFAEGPGGGHYENIVGDYTKVGCGIHVTASDDVWVVHNFH